MVSSTKTKPSKYLDPSESDPIESSENEDEESDDQPLAKVAKTSNKTTHHSLPLPTPRIVRQTRTSLQPSEEAASRPFPRFVDLVTSTDSVSESESGRSETESDVPAVKEVAARKPTNQSTEGNIIPSTNIDTNTSNKKKHVEDIESSDFDISDAESVLRSPNNTKHAPKNSIPAYEVERAAVDRLHNLCKYRKIFEPFVTPKVMSQMNNVLIEKQKGGVSAGNREDDYVRIPQPRVLSAVCKMREYQLEGFSWLVSNYNKSINCILADEMGLGKTLQSIACIAQLALVQKLSGPYLFIVPLSVLFNWMNEFKKWCPALHVVRLHSNDKDEQLRLRKVLNSNTTQVVVTTYDTVKSGGLMHTIRSIVWRSVFLDEGHRIKNENSDVAKACHSLRARFRVILTGTPVQNNLHEFGALLSFLAPNVFTQLSLFDAAFNLKVNSGSGGKKGHGSGGGGGEKQREGKCTLFVCVWYVSEIVFYV